MLPPLGLEDCRHVSSKIREEKELKINSEFLFLSFGHFLSKDLIEK